MSNSKPLECTLLRIIDLIYLESIMKYKPPFMKYQIYMLVKQLERKVTYDGRRIN